MKDDAPVRFVKPGEDPLLDAALRPSGAQPPRAGRSGPGGATSARGTGKAQAKYAALAAGCVIVVTAVAFWAGRVKSSEGRGVEMGATTSATGTGSAGGGTNVRGVISAPPASAGTSGVPGTTSTSSALPSGGVPSASGAAALPSSAPTGAASATSSVKTAPKAGGGGAAPPKATTSRPGAANVDPSTTSAPTAQPAPTASTPVTPPLVMTAPKY